MDRQLRFLMSFPMVCAGPIAKGPRPRACQIARRENRKRTGHHGFRHVLPCDVMPPADPAMPVLEFRVPADRGTLRPSAARAGAQTPQLVLPWIGWSPQFPAGPIVRLRDAAS